MVASKLSALAEHSLNARIELDLGHWSRGGARKTALLGSRGSSAIKTAVGRNRVRTETETIVGRLRTASDGADQVRLTLADDASLRMTVEPDVGVAIGPLLGQQVEVDVETEIRWKLASGVEKRPHHLVAARLYRPPTQPTFDEEAWSSHRRAGAPP